MNFSFSPQAIPDVIVVEPKPFGDARGFFMEAYKASVYQANGVTSQFVQDNLARSVGGVLRGLHYQKDPAACAKLVTVLEGEVLDVAVDMRRGAPTYGQWLGVTLSAENRRQLFVPEGFAHGYLVRSETALLSYKVSYEYVPDCDRGVLWNDPAIGIDWGATEPILSDKDRAQPTLEQADNTFVYRG